MPTIRNTIVIDRPPDEVWLVLADLDGVTGWVPGVATARMEGMTRRCTLADGNGEITEEITELSDERRSYSYEQTSHPLGFRSSRGRFTVEADGEGSRVLWDAEIEFAEPSQEAQFLPLLEQGYRAALEGLKARVAAT